MRRGNRDPWHATSRRMGTASSMAASSMQAQQTMRFNVQEASSTGSTNGETFSGGGQQHSSLQIPGFKEASVININVNCGVNCNDRGCERGWFGSYAPTLNGMWPLPPLSYGSGFAPPGFVYGCPPGPLLLTPMTTSGFPVCFNR